VSPSSRVQYIASRFTSLICNIWYVTPRNHQNSALITLYRTPFQVMNNSDHSTVNFRVLKHTIISIAVAKFIASAINRFLGRQIVLLLWPLSTWSVSWSHGSTAGAMKELYMSVITHPCRLRGDFLSCCHLCAPFPECQYMRISCAPEKTRRPPSRAFARTLFEFNSIWPHLSGPVLQILIKKQYQWRSCTSEAPFYL
jgi:hypothetical protein